MEGENHNASPLKPPFIEHEFVAKSMELRAKRL
jgi:hypothetical protein